MFQCENTHSISSSFTAPIETQDGKSQTPRWQRKSSSFHNSTMDAVNTSNRPTSTPRKNRSSTTTTPSRTPGKYPRTPSKSRTPSKYSAAGDRFIPNRSAMDFDSGHFKLLHEGPNLETKSPSKLEDERRFKENLNANFSNSKIMSFKRKAPFTEGILDAQISQLICNSIPSLPRPFDLP